MKRIRTEAGPLLGMLLALMLTAGVVHASPGPPPPSLLMVGTNADVTNPDHPQFGAAMPSSPLLTITTAQSPASVMDEHIALEKTFDTLEPIWTTWVRGPNAPDIITLEETVLNQTGFAWYDFHVYLTGGAFFVENQDPEMDPEPVKAELSPDLTQANIYYLPPIPNGQDLSFGMINGVPDPTDVLIDISAIGVDETFTIVQYPTVIPEPTTLLLLGGGVLGWVVRRRRR